MSSACQNTSSSSSSKAIPTTRRVAVHEADHMPQDYSTTPGGTLFSTTPGGTRIIYDRKFLLECRRSPVAKTPPRCLPDIPGVTSPPSKLTLHDNTLKVEPLVNNNNLIIAPADKSGGGDDAQFEMDI